MSTYVLVEQLMEWHSFLDFSDLHGDQKPLVKLKVALGGNDVLHYQCAFQD